MSWRRPARPEAAPFLSGQPDVPSEVVRELSDPDEMAAGVSVEMLPQLVDSHRGCGIGHLQ